MREARRLLSARKLNDVPASVRIGSPHDAPDHLVLEWAKQGVLHPSTNYGVVYRAAFAQVLTPGEAPASGALSALPVEGMPTSLIMRYCWVAPPERFSETGDEFIVSGRDLSSGFLGAWVLLTNLGIRWHYTGDGAPTVHPGASAELGGGIRRLGYDELRGGSAHHQVAIPVSGTQADVDFFVFHAVGRFFAFGFAGAYAPENLRWYEYVTHQP